MWRPEHVGDRVFVAETVADGLRTTAGLVVRTVVDAARSVVDLAMPPSCPGCRVRLGASGGLCIDCWETLKPLEEPWCERLGLPFAYDLGPGTLSALAIADPPSFSRSRAAVAYEGAAPALVHAFKYADRTDLVDLLAGQMARAGRELLRDCDMVAPIPLHRWRLFSRRYNQAALLARALAVRAGKPFAPTLVRRVRQTRQQVGLSRESRAENMRGAFAVDPARRRLVAGARVLLVDDVFTTGATLEAATRMLKRAGARDVDVLTFARVVATP